MLVLGAVGSHLRSNVVGYLALFVALGGTAWAAATIGAEDIRRNAVRSKHIKNGQVTTKDLRNGHVRAADVRAASLTGAKIADESLGSVDVGGLSGADIGDESLGSADITGLSGVDVLDNSLTGADVVESSLTGVLMDFEVVKVQTGSSSDPTRNASAQCPVGKRVIGGGASVLFGGSQSVGLSTSGPPFNDLTPETEDWHASASEIVATPQSWALEVTAYCARIAG